jgi:fatty-acyl-CoA synthase
MAAVDAMEGAARLCQTPGDGASQVAGPRDVPPLELTIPTLLAARIDALAGGLLKIGIGQGDRVGIWAPNRSEWVLTQFAAARIGAILVNINPAHRVHELAFASRETGCAALIPAERIKTSDYVAMIRDPTPELASAEPGGFRAGDLPALRSVIVCGVAQHSGCFAFPEIEAKGAGVPKARLDAITDTLDPNDAIDIQFTSGTTGLPKGATLTHRNIVDNAAFVTAAMALTDADRPCIPVPFYHCFGMVMGTLGCVTKGAAMVIPGEGFDPEATSRTVSEEGCTVLHGVPTMFVAVLEHPDFARFDLSRQRTGIMAGAPCTIEVMRRVQRDMNMTEVTIAHGVTETSPVSFPSSTDTPLDRRAPSVGRVQPHLEVRIIDETGAVVPVGAQGELQTRGYSVMQGHWDDPEKTAMAIDVEGWMHTGDLATLDAEGYCNITGRVKDMIIRGGENISPREIEEFLCTHSSVSRVQVFGIPDDLMGEAVAAWIVPKPGTAPNEDEIRDFRKDRIAHFEVPALVRMKEALPMTVTGKPQRFLMREAMVEELGLVKRETA